MEICFSNTDEKKIYRKGIGAQNVCMTIIPLILRQIWNDYRYTVKNFVAAALSLDLMDLLKARAC